MGSIHLLIIIQVEASPGGEYGHQVPRKVLSIRTAGKNRYLLHFSSLNHLTFWAAAIRSTIFENTMLQESYTGALIAGKGRTLNNIMTILERTRFKYEDWVRVRVSPGTPWRRCWCVITPPDEKEAKKLRRAQKKNKKSSYDRSAVVVKGTVKFYETKKTKKTKPLVTVFDAYAAFAIYPQARPLIEQSTLVKIEGQITIHTQPEKTRESFVFVLPELHPGVSGLEIMLRFLFPVFDTFHLYGRPTRLLADRVSTRSLMFAMPLGKKVAYLDNLDVGTLIHTEGSHTWSEEEWRRRMKEVAARRMTSNSIQSNSRASSVAGSRYQRSSVPVRNGMAVRFGGVNSGTRLENNHSTDAVFAGGQRHSVGTSGHLPGESLVSNGYGGGARSSRNSLDKPVLEGIAEQLTPRPDAISPYDGAYHESTSSKEGSESIDSPRPNSSSGRNTFEQLRPNTPPSSILAPPKFIHGAKDMPQHKPRPSSELKRANSRVSYGTLAQMAEMNRTRGMATTGAASGLNNETGTHAEGQDQKINTYEPSTAPVDTSPVSPVSPLPSDGGFRSPTTTSRPVSLEYVAQRQPTSQPTSPQKIIPRKPVPQPLQKVETASTTSESSLGSLRGAIDIDALDRVMTRARTPSPPPRRIPQSQVRDEESVYDQSSVASPDYASSVHSSISKHSSTSVQRPRTGVLRVVGTQEPQHDDVVIGDARYQHAEAAPAAANPDIPLVDFGPTHTLLPTTRRPSTSDTLTLLSHSRNKSDATLVGNEKKVASPGRTTPGPGIEGQQADKPSEERRRSVLWQPGMNSSPGNRMSMTSEQFVQQRAEQASLVSGHHRRTSSRTTAASPRPVTGDWTAYAQQQPARRERPHSRGPSATLSQLDLSSRLSAREQEHVARMTGSSFFNLSSEANKSQPIMSAGLVGAIDAREREKKAMKEGYGGHMVQQAIAQRQCGGQWSGSANSQYPASTYGLQTNHRYNDSDTIPYGQYPQQQWVPRPSSQQALYNQPSPSSIYPESVYPPRPSSHQTMYPQGPPSTMYQENSYFR